jgi:transcriptional regulator with PAS, ATPase and Fis domain
MTGFEWLENMEIAVTVCDRDGVGLYLNDRAARTFEKHGGKALVGKSLLDCHPEPARSKMLSLLRDPRPHSYILEKNGRKKFIHAAPWLKAGKFAGLVEIAADISFEKLNMEEDKLKDFFP